MFAGRHPAPQPLASLRTARRVAWRRRASEDREGGARAPRAVKLAIVPLLCSRERRPFSGGGATFAARSRPTPTFSETFSSFNECVRSLCVRNLSILSRGSSRVHTHSLASRPGPPGTTALRATGTPARLRRALRHHPRPHNVSAQHARRAPTASLERRTTTSRRSSLAYDAVS